MTQLVIVLLALAAAPGGTRLPAPPAEVAPIALYTQFQQEPPQAVTDALRDELEFIMAPLGLRFEWRSLPNVRGDEIAVELAVLTFKGRCDVTGLLPRTTNPGALGWTHVSDGNILPFSDIECDRIRGFIQKDLLAVHPEEREDAYGRAIARVVAHELYHIFANTSQHGSFGVGKSAYTAQELLSDDFQFEAKESMALRNSKARELLDNATRAPGIE
jgi:hypothetical protein